MPSRVRFEIIEFGFNNPILVDTKAGIIAGHGRLLAARKLQLHEVPVIVLGHLTEAQKRAYILADNQLALNTGWDDLLPRQQRPAGGRLASQPRPLKKTNRTAWWSVEMSSRPN